MTHMPHMTSIAAFALMALAATPIALPQQAQAQVWTNSAAYNGYGTANMNTASNYSMRDANGNLTMVNGQVTSATYGYSSGGQTAYAGGVGVGNAPSTFGEATAVGNQLSVVVVGSHNTTIVDSTQINNGNQTATADLSRH